MIYNKFQVNLKVKRNMKIGELARRAGLSASAIRYYEEQGLLPAPARGASGYRDYDEAALQSLACILGGKKLGFSLETMRSLAMGAQPCFKGRALEETLQRLREIEQLQQALAAQHSELTALQASLESEMRNWRLANGGAPSDVAVQAVKAAAQVG